MPIESNSIPENDREKIMKAINDAYTSDFLKMIEFKYPMYEISSIFVPFFPFHKAPNGIPIHISVGEILFSEKGDNNFKRCSLEEQNGKKFMLFARIFNKNVFKEKIGNVELNLGDCLSFIERKRNENIKFYKTYQDEITSDFFIEMCKYFPKDNLRLYRTLREQDDGSIVDYYSIYNEKWDKFFNLKDVNDLENDSFYRKSMTKFINKKLSLNEDIVDFADILKYLEHIKLVDY